MTSPAAKVKFPGAGSIASHFIEFAGVICPKSDMFASAAEYAESESSPLSVAVPKKRSPWMSKQRNMILAENLLHAWLPYEAGHVREKSTLAEISRTS